MENPFDPQRKMLCQLRKVCQWLEDPYAIPPSLVEIAPSNVCNHACTHCMYAYTHANEKLDYLTMDHLTTDLAEMGVPAITWTGGGEPLTNRVLYESDLLYKVKLKGLKQGLYTNGSLLTNDDHMTKILQTHEWVRFSLDAATSQTYQAVHNPSTTWDTVLGNIREFVALREELGSTTTIGIGMVVTPLNYNDMSAFFGLKDQLGVDYAQFKPSIQLSDWQERAHTYFEAWTQIYEWTDSENGNFLTKYKWQDCFAKKLYDVCFAHYFLPYVGADGKVYLCPQLQGLDDWALGSLADASFREIWDGEQRKRVIDALNSSGLTHCPKACRGNEINKFLWDIDHSTVPHKEFI